MTDVNTEIEGVTTNETVVEEKDELTIVREELAKAQEDRDNYKKVALARKGKLANDDQFFAEGSETELTVAEQVRLALLESDVEKKQAEAKRAQDKLIKENSELRIALKNQPSSTAGGSGSGSTTTVKDNFFSEAQLVALRERAAKNNIDPEKYIAGVKQNLLNRGLN